MEWGWTKATRSPAEALELALGGFCFWNSGDPSARRYRLSAPWAGDRAEGESRRGAPPTATVVIIAMVARGPPEAGRDIGAGCRKNITSMPGPGGRGAERNRAAAGSGARF